jgi:hypothetical protein
VKKRLWYCYAFPNYSAIQAIVHATSAREAQVAATDRYYGRPSVRPAKLSEVRWHLDFGGRIIGADRRGEA